MRQRDKPDDFVLATGETKTIRQFLDFTFDRLAIELRKHVEIDPRYFRPTKANLLLRDYSTAKSRWLATEDLMRGIGPDHSLQRFGTGKAGDART